MTKLYDFDLFAEKISRSDIMAFQQLLQDLGIEYSITVRHHVPDDAPEQTNILDEMAEMRKKLVGDEL